MRSRNSNRTVPCRRVTPGLPILAVLAAVVVACTSCVPMMRHAGLPSRPAALETPRVVTGSSLLAKAAFLAKPPMEVITDLRWGEHLSPPGPKLCAASAEGAIFTDRQGAVLSTVTFNCRLDRLSILPSTDAAGCQFIDRGSWSSNATLFAHDGAQLWTYGGSSGVDDMAAGDVDGDGRLEFVVGFNGGGGVHLLDNQGKKRWQQADGNVWHVEIADLDGTGHQQILHSCAAGEMVLRDKDGNVIRRLHPPNYFSQFAVCPWPDSAGAQRVICAGEAGIFVIDATGQAVATLSAPDAAELNDLFATPVRLAAGQPASFAVVLSYRHWDRSVLYVYDAKRTLVYEEVIAGPCGAVTALPTGSADAEALLVGGTANLWRYDLAAH